MASDREPTGYRGVLVAVAFFILAISAALLWNLHPEEPHLLDETGYKEQDVGYHPGGSACHPSTINRLPWGQRQKRAEVCDEAREQHRLIADDLMQQRRTANATEASAALSYNQAWIALWGLIFGVAALAAASLAAFYTGKAVDVARRNGEAEVRAYLAIELEELKNGITWREDPRIPYIRFKLKNKGRTPAINVRWKSLLTTNEYADDREQFFNEELRLVDSPSTISSDDYVEDIALPRRHADTFDNIDIGPEGTILLICLIWVRYETVLKDAGAKDTTFEISLLGDGWEDEYGNATRYVSVVTRNSRMT